MVLSHLGEKLHAAFVAHMAKRRITHAEAGRRLGVTQQCVTQKLKSIRAGQTSLRTLEKFAHALGLKLGAIVEEAS